EGGRAPGEPRELRLGAEAPDPGDKAHAVGCPSAGRGLWVYSYGRVRGVSEVEWTDASRIRRSARVVESQVPINPGDSGGPLVNDRGEGGRVHAPRHPHA